MKETDELEPQQYENLYWEESVPLKDVRKSVLRKFVYIGTFVLIIFMLMGYFVKFPDQIELPFLLKSDQSEDIFQFPNPVYIVEKYVESGKPIKKDKPLLKITSPEIVEMINVFQSSEQALANFNNQKTLSVQKQKESIVIGVGQNKNTIADIQNQLSSLTKNWEDNKIRLQYEYENMAKKYEANKKLYEDSVISKFTFLETERDKIVAANNLANAIRNYEREKDRLTALYSNYRLNTTASYSDLNRLTIDTKYDSVALNNQFTSAKDKIKNTFVNYEIVDGAIVLLASRDGLVSYIFDGEKEVAPGAILLKLLYSNSPLYASVDCPPSLIGKVKKDQLASLKIASFPFYEWGTAKGSVKNVSLSPDENGNFPVKIEMQNFGRLKNLTQAGMNGTVTIILEEKTFYDYFFRKIKKAYYNATFK